MVARAHPESDSATGAGHKQVPTGCAQDESDKKSVSSKKWECFTQCKPLTVFEADAIVSFKQQLAHKGGGTRGLGNQK